MINRPKAHHPMDGKRAPGRPAHVSVPAAGKVGTVSAEEALPYPAAARPTAPSAPATWPPEEQAPEQEQLSAVPAPPAAMPAATQPPRGDRANRRRPADDTHEQLCQLATSLFLRAQAPVRCLGFTSLLPGEGKTFLALAMARMLAYDLDQPVTLVECNWERSELHTQFDLPLSPGLAEWARGESDLSSIRHRINAQLCVISAGNAGDLEQNRVRLVRQLSRLRVPGALRDPRDERVLLFDLPALTSCTYAAVAARLPEELVIVHRVGGASRQMITSAMSQLEGLKVEGMILNREQSRLPRWLRRLL